MRALALCLILAAAPAAAQVSPFPFPHNRTAASRIVDFELTVRACPSIVRGPKARDLWRGLLATYQPGRADVPAIKAWLRSEIAKGRQGPPPARGWCEEAKYLYGELGRIQPHAIVMRDGSTPEARCLRDGSCAPSNTIDVWLY